MPYPFAHPAAVIPLARPMGRFGVPSALVIGSVVPDFWYFLPMLDREASHSAAGLFWFCLPAGLALYFAFHLLFKEPMVAFAPRWRAFYRPGLPPAPLYAVLVSLLAGVLTHLGWDALTHGEGMRIAQHASTVLGTFFVIWWLWRRLKELPETPSRSGSRLSIIALLTIASAAWAWHEAAAANLVWSLQLHDLRRAARVAGISALEGLAVAFFAYCVVQKGVRGILKSL